MGIVTTILNNHEPYYRVGGDFSFNYRTFNVYGLYMYGHDSNNLPVDATGGLIPLPLGPESPTAAGFVRGIPATFSGGFVQADYMVLPWIMAIMRWDQVELFGGSHQRPGVRDEYAVFRALQFEPGPLYPWRAVPDSRQHQGFLRIPDPAATVCNAREPSERQSSRYEPVQGQYGGRRARICLLTFMRGAYRR